MHIQGSNPDNTHQLYAFFAGKSEHTLMLFNHFVTQFTIVADIRLYPAKSMIGIGNPEKRIAWITQLGKNFIHVVFPFKEPHYGNLCFTKIAQVAGSSQFNHHFRMYRLEDINAEVIRYMQVAISQ